MTIAIITSHAKLSEIKQQQFSYFTDLGVKNLTKIQLGLVTCAQLRWSPMCSHTISPEWLFQSGWSSIAVGVSQNECPQRTRRILGGLLWPCFRYSIISFSPLQRFSNQSTSTEHLAMSPYIFDWHTWGWVAIGTSGSSRGKQWIGPCPTAKMAQNINCAEVKRPNKSCRI